MSNISQEEMLIIAVIVAVCCMIGAIALSAVIFLWYRKSKAAKQALAQKHAAASGQNSAAQEAQASGYAAFSPPPSSSPIGHQAEANAATSSSDSSYDHQGINMEQPPLSDHVSEFDAIEPMSEPFPKSNIDDIVPQAPIDTLDLDPMTEVEGDTKAPENEGEIGENDATVLMQRPSRPQN